MPKKSPNETSPVAHFEQSLEELEQLVQKMADRIVDKLQLS